MRSARIAVLAAALLLSLPSPASAATRTELLDRIDRAIALADAGRAAPGAEVMDRVRAAVGLPDVVVEGSRSIRVPADPVLEDLEGTTSGDLERAARHLRELRRILAAPPASSTDERTLREQLTAAYAGGAVADPSLMDRALEAVGSFLSWVTREAGEAVAGGPGLLLLIVAAVAALVFLLRRRAFSVVPEAAAAGDRRSAPDWRRLAEEARARGDLREAISCLYRGMVAELASVGVVQDRPSLTAREVRLATALEDRLAGPIAEASRRYELVRYGGQPPTSDDVASLERAGAAAHRAR